MYAVIEQGGKQHKVEQGDWLDIELMEVPADAKTMELDKVLLVSDGKSVKIGSPYVEGAKVVVAFDSTAKDAVVKGLKVYPQYFRRRKNSKKRIGHRQQYLHVKVETIQA
jgi:large subunit ribosomal protein L21